MESYIFNVTTLHTFNIRRQHFINICRNTNTNIVGLLSNYISPNNNSISFSNPSYLLVLPLTVRMIHRSVGVTMRW